MNYSVFKLQNEGGKPAIYWDKETIPKADRKFGYKKKEQRFPIRRYADDTHLIERDLVNLTPDEPPSPSKPRTNFIKLNKDLIISKKTALPSTVTLTQEQLNAILRSVGKVASGVDSAVKISIDHTKGKDEIVVEESPKRRDKDEEDDDDNDDDIDDYDDRRKKLSRRKTQKNSDEPSIYSLIDKPKAKASLNGESQSDFESQISEASIELQHITQKYQHSKGRKHKDNKDDDDDDNNIRDHRYRKSKYKEDDDIVNDDKKKRHNISKREYRDIDYINDDDNLRDRRKMRNRYKNKQDELDSVSLELRKQQHRSKHDKESADESKDNRQKQIQSKRTDSYQENDIDSRERTVKREKVKKDNETNRKDTKPHKESHDRETNLHVDSINNFENLPSPRDKVGLPEDLSWRHMTKAERKRLEMARQKIFDDEEKKEEERIQQLNAKYGLPPNEPFKTAPQKYKHPRSDPVTHITRQEIGRDTEISNYTDSNHGVHRSPSSHRTPERTPDFPSYTTPDISLKLPVGVPRRHLTLAEKKRLEWERDRVESVQIEKGSYDPWGRPGAGAPLRTKSGSVLADYKGRKNQLQNAQYEIIQEDTNESKHSRGQNKKETDIRQDGRTSHKIQIVIQKPIGNQLDQQNVPHAMRSSFVLGEAAPDYDRFNTIKEKERKQWLADLEKQIEQKRQKDVKQKESADDNSWTDKLGQSHHPAPFPEQPKETVARDGDTNGDQGGAVLPLESFRTKSEQENIQGDNQSFIRGQNVPLDPASRRELEEKRKKYLEHQAAIKSQVEEKERLKRMEHEKKIKEDMEEERKLKQERETLQNQFDTEQQKIRQKEQLRQAQVNQLKAAMDDAQAKALQEKFQRKMEHLEAGGHDTSKLREHLEAKMTPRRENPEGMNMNEPTVVPGLDLSTVREYHQPQYMPQKTNTHREQPLEPYLEDRVLTPTRYRQQSKLWSDPESPRREFGTQTGDDLVKMLNKSQSQEEPNVNIEYQFEKGKRVRVISAPKEVLQKRLQQPKQNNTEPRLPKSHRELVCSHDHHHEVRKQREMEEAIRKKRLEKHLRKGPVRPGSRPMWGYKNPDRKKPQKQSEKDLFYEQKKIESEERRIKREKQLLNMIERNRDVIPDHYSYTDRSRSISRDQSPFSDINIESPRDSHHFKRSKSHSPNRKELQGETNFIKVHSDTEANREEHQDYTQSPSHSNMHNELHHHDDANFYNRPSQNVNKSPPVPALKKFDHNYHVGNDGTQRKGGRYGDINPLDAPVHNGDFVPFTRTIDVLDPSKAEEPLPLSREATKVANARRAYYEGLHPDKFGNRQYVFQDKHRVVVGNDGGKNPLLNPSLVLDHPTTRQDQILVQLSTLKQSLMQRQRELETFSPTDLVRQDLGVLRV